MSAQNFVDLGLSVKWCTVNTGITADRPVGWYYRWPDAMAIKTTDGSRMGTKAEWDELRQYCTWKWTEQDGIGGYLVTSKVKGYTDRSIFLPAAGWLQDGQLMQVGTYASYWCSTPGVQPDDEAAYGFNFKRGADEWHSENRESEQSVRMVMPLSGKEVSNIKLEKNKLSIKQGAGIRLKVTMGKRDVNSACTWKSSDKEVIKVVEDGLLVAAGPGSCKVQVTAYGKTAQCTVTVTPHEFEYVDLGLSVLWANANLGASAPESYGDYYAWAEIEPKETFSWGNYRYSSFAQEDGMDKYTAQGQSHQYLKADNLNRLEPTDDAATVMLGDGWRIPTNDEIVELVKNCTYDTVTVNGTHGIRFTSNVPGFDGHSIFIPYSGQMNGNEPIEIGKQFSLWTSIPGSGTRGSCFSTIGSVNGMMGGLSELPPIEVLRMAFDFMFNGYESRFIGMNIRPVRSLTDDMFTSLSLPAERIDISYGAIRNVEAVMKPSGRPVKPTSINWSSSAPQIVSIDENGFLTAVGQGTCVITAETEGRKAQMTVNVSLPVPEPVDLGLSVMWASANLGASRPDEAGGYFAWGETSPKPGLYSGENYKFGQYTNEMTKYNFYTSPGQWGGAKYPLDYKQTLDPEDDAAAVLLGNGWRMPTADELWELKNRCTWEAKYAQDTIEYNHEDTVELFFEKRLLGYVITSNVPGYEDRSIWLPAAGYISDYNHDSYPVNSRSAHYWTSTLGQSLDNGDRRWNGKNIRPVMELPQSENRPKAGPDPVKPLRHNAQVDLGLSVLWADCNVGADSPQETGARFAWGETAPKTYYSEYNYKHMKAFKELDKWWYSKYTTTDDDPYVDGLTRLSAEDDAARANWGGKWRMPTKEEYKELYEKCEWTLDSVNGVKGYRITSKVPGYTDKSIFLPYNSNTFGGLFEEPNKGIYLTSDKKSSEKGYMWRGCVVLEFDKYEFGTSDEVELDFKEDVRFLGGSRMSKIHITARDRTNGYCVRAVCDR